MNARDLKHAANEILNDLAMKHPGYASTLVRIQFKISTRMTRAAGTAYPARFFIKLSLPFFASEENFKKAFRNVVTHEIAHILCPPVRLPGRTKRDSHGRAWQAMHILLGGDGERCHELELSAGFTKRQTSYVHLVPCSQCGSSVAVLGRQARAYREGLSTFRHRACPPR